MLELISMIVLGYYLVMAVVLLVLLAWGRIDECRKANRRGSEPRIGNGRQTSPGMGQEHDPERQAACAADNVVTFRRNK